MILYQVHNVFHRQCSGTTVLPKRPEPNDVAEAVGWDGRKLYELGGAWVCAEDLGPVDGLRYGTRLFAGRVGTGGGFWVWAVQDRCDRYVAVTAQRVRHSHGKWEPNGPIGHAGVVPVAARRLLMVNGQRLRWLDGKVEPS